MATTEEVIRRYFDAGHTYEVIVDMLSTFHNITMSVRTLKTRLREAGLFRRKNYSPLAQNAKMFHLNDGLSVFSGSLSSYTCILVTICLLIQTCGGHEVTTSNWPPLNSSTTSSGHEVTTSNRPLLNSSTTSSGHEVTTSNRPLLNSSTTSPGHEVTMSNWPPLNSSTTSSGHEVTTSNWPLLNSSTTSPGHEVTTSNRPLLNSSTTSS
ncbi:cell wall integrity and stress response component 2-like, partial [Seriola lalandi dorsalis]|uniref:cell wall integrity and stress response component 2-like n=1 Tax=Seriola lalandi dorsalis TaxID=1841481 RepID=UPI000C6F7749